MISAIPAARRDSVSISSFFRKLKIFFITTFIPFRSALRRNRIILAKNLPAVNLKAKTGTEELQENRKIYVIMKIYTTKRKKNRKRTLANIDIMESGHRMEIYYKKKTFPGSRQDGGNTISQDGGIV